uniref:Peptidase S1 domain-containing protein n=1 Tax=Calidris pygmaea TaxID=425635 RepID=A0A8C3KID8_9CHAR
MELLPIILLLLLTGTIIGGSPCIPFSQPWQVYIYSPVLCGGILLRDNWVLTAAHCNSSNPQLPSSYL